MSTTRVEQRINAPPSAVYHAIIDAASVQAWQVPYGMTSEVHEFEASEGGRFRISLTYEDTSNAGKTSAHTDTYHGYFAALVQNERIVEVIEFETGDPSMAGEMTVTYTLHRDGEATVVEGLHENLPPGVKPEDNEYGWRMSLGKLAELVEGRTA